MAQRSNTSSNIILEKRLAATQRCLDSADTLVKMRTAEAEAANKKCRQLETINGSLSRTIKRLKEEKAVDGN